MNRGYIVDKAITDDGHTVYYCHHKDFPAIPVFGSIGSYQKAKAMCDAYNGKEPKRKGDKDG